MRRDRHEAQAQKHEAVFGATRVLLFGMVSIDHLQPNVLSVACVWMPQISTKVDLCQGHDACAPRPFSSFSPNVLAEGFEVARETDSFTDHGCSKHPPHGAVVREGWPSVTVNGNRIAYVGAPVTCASGVVGTGRVSVFVGEGSRLSHG